MDIRLSEAREQLVRELKLAYQTSYKNIQAIPCLKIKTTSLDSIFVEGNIECLTENSKNIEKWELLETYKHLRSDPRIKSNRRVIEGEPGCGKSLLTIQIAHDWSADKHGSFVNDIEILIVLQLRQLEGMTSIYDCIKQLILPKDSKLEIDDIKHVLRHTSSVLFVLDSVDEFPDYDTTIKNDVLAIINNDMFPHFEVVLTTRTPYLSERFSSNCKRIKLTGFGALAQDKYLRKVVTKDDDAATERIKESLQDNPVLRDFCRIPFFFVIYAHNTYENDTLGRYTNMTGYFRQVISCFQDHFIRKMEDHEFQKVVDIVGDHRVLNKVAYESLVGCTEQTWNRDYICQILGEDVYDQYLRIGIFCKDRKKEDGSVTIRFNHNLFREWYSANYIVDVIAQHDSDPDNSDDELILEMIDDLYPLNYQNLYRFVCGINSDVAKYIIQYLRDIEGNDQFTITCILEQSGTSQNVFDTLKDLCSDTLHISHADTMLWQRSIIQILEIASKHKVPISSLMLHEAIESVDVSKHQIMLKSGLCLSTQNTLKYLWIGMTGEDWNEDKLQSIFDYAFNCEQLNRISFSNCPMPHRFKDLSILSRLREREVEVRWYPTLICYRLNLQYGHWQNIASPTPLSEKDVERVVNICKAVNQ